MGYMSLLADSSKDTKLEPEHHGFNPADGPAYGLPYPTAAAGRKVSRYRKRTWQRRMKKRVSAAMTKLEGMTG